MENKKKNAFCEWLSKHYVIVLIVICLLILMSPSLLTLKSCDWIKQIYGGNIDFSDTGEIGDTMGGITAPFVGLLSVILLFITFREQRKFNKEQIRKEQENRDFTILFKQIELFDKGIRVEIKGVSYYGVYALEEFNKNYFDLDTQQKKSFFIMIGVPINTLMSYLTIINRSTLDVNSKEYFHVAFRNHAMLLKQCLTKLLLTGGLPEYSAQIQQLKLDVDFIWQVFTTFSVE